MVRRQFTLQNKTERLQIQLREEDAMNEAYQRQTAREQVRLAEVQEAQARLAKEIAGAVAETSARWLHSPTRLTYAPAPRPSPRQQPAPWQAAPGGLLGWRLLG